MGKTVMVLVLCALHTLKQNLVFVVLVKELLYEQFNSENNLYFGEKPAEFELLANLTPDAWKNRILILDEADYGINPYAAYFDADPFGPVVMVALKSAKQVVFLSATYDNFARSFLLKCFDITDVRFASFKTAT